MDNKNKYIVEDSDELTDEDYIFQSKKQYILKKDLLSKCYVLNSEIIDIFNILKKELVDDIHRNNISCIYTDLIRYLIIIELVDNIKHYDFIKELKKYYKLFR